jgi:hypothetical protein
MSVTSAWFEDADKAKKLLRMSTSDGKRPRTQVLVLHTEEAACRPITLLALQHLPVLELPHACSCGCSLCCARALTAPGICRSSARSASATSTRTKRSARAARTTSARTAGAATCAHT